MTTATAIRGNVTVAVKGQPARARWEQKLMQKGMDEGMGASQELRFVCRIAQDANEAFEIIEDAEGNVWTINPKAKAQFGRNSRGLAYLTVGLINEATDERVRLTWEGDAVPSKMKEVAVKHDEGKRVAATRIRLRLQDADRKVLHDRRTDEEKQAGREYIRSVRAGERTATPRNHGRLCRDDLS